MKNWTWKQWTALGITLALIIVFVVLHLVQPQVSYAWLEAMCAGTFVLGGVSGFLIGKGKSPVQINS